MSELRQDIVSGDWVVIAPARADRPMMLKKKAPRKPAPRATCPFENLEKSKNWPPIAAYPNREKWRLVVVPNKYPALTHHGEHIKHFRHGVYHAATGVGDCELVITRDHTKDFSMLAPVDAREVFDAFVARHRASAEDPCLTYVTTFLNFGASVGGSLWHPHYQVISLPFVPPHIVHSLAGARRYFEAHGRCARCALVKFERKERTRVIAENDDAIAIAPYASKRAFEVTILSKKHFPSFHETPVRVVHAAADLVRSVMGKIKKKVNDPDLNFFIHDTPLNGKRYPYHHWHIELTPNLSLLGGLEFSTGVYVNSVDPDRAAKILREK